MLQKYSPAQVPEPILPGRPELLELYYFAWERAAAHITHSKHFNRAHMHCAWDMNRNYQWVIDTCFMTFFCRYAPQVFPGIESLDNFYDLQRADGFIGMTYDMDSGEEAWPGYINPPLLAWAEEDYYLATGDASRLPRVLPHIARFLNWIEENRRTAPHRRNKYYGESPRRRGWNVDEFYQLYWFDDGGCTMDDSPRTPRQPGAGQFFDWLDLSCQMAMSFEQMARLHRALGEKSEAEAWQDRYLHVSALINSELWCEKSGFYHDRALPFAFVANKTIAGFWPLLAGFCPPERVASLLRHLQDPAEFGSAVPVRTLAAHDPNYLDGVDFSGGVWAPTNYMVLRGLVRAGHHELAHELALRYISSLQRVYEQVEPHTLWECYRADGDGPGLHNYYFERKKPDFTGWSALGPLAMFLEQVLGLQVNAPAGRITWHLLLDEACGVRRLGVGNHAVADLEAEPNGAEMEVRIRSSRALEVMVVRHGTSTLIKAAPEQTMNITVGR